MALVFSTTLFEKTFDADIYVIIVVVASAALAAMHIGVTNRWKSFYHFIWLCVMRSMGAIPYFLNDSNAKEKPFNI